MIDSKLKKLHVQNIFDALNFEGLGVKGKLMDKCLYLQNRSVLMAKEGDAVVVSHDFPFEFGSYILELTQNEKVDIIPIDSDIDDVFGAEQLFLNLNKKVDSIPIDKDSIDLSPYINSKSFYSAARKYEWSICDSDWETYVNNDLSLLMNDKVSLHEECLDLGIPIPKYWALSKDNLISEVLIILSVYKKILIRQSRSGGGLGNLIVEKIDEGKFEVVGVEEKKLVDSSELKNYLAEFSQKSISDDFVVSQFLDLYASPGTLFYIDNKEVKIISHTDQILNGQSAYTGFKYPISDNKISKWFPSIEKYVIELGKIWQNKGYRGYGNIDWMITKSGSVFIAERNARQTSIVPLLTLISNIFYKGSSNIKLPKGKAIYAKDFVFVNKEKSLANIISELENRNLLFDRKKGEGLIVTIPPVTNMKKTTFGLMAIGNNEQQVNQLFQSVNITD